MSDAKTSDTKTAFKVKTPSEAFHDYTESEVLRMRETDAQFDEDFYRQAQQLVASRLTVTPAPAQLQSDKQDNDA